MMHGIVTDDATRLSVKEDGPTAATVRLRGVDALRGVALLGILVANVRQMFLPWGPAEFPVSLGERHRLAWIDWQLFHSLVDLKFLTLFSLLFGLGFALQNNRAQNARDAFAGLYLRRLAVLAAFGLAHGLLLYPAEVLLPYAVAGFLLLLAERWPAQALIRVGLFLLGTSTIWQYQIASVRPFFPDVIVTTAVLLAATLTFLWQLRAWVAVSMSAIIVCAGGWVLTSRGSAGSPGVAANEYREAREQLAAMRSDESSAWPEEVRVRKEEGFGALVGLHARQYADILLGFAIVLLWRTLGLFMIGAGLFRLGLFTSFTPSIWRRVAVVGLGIGLPLSVLATWMYGRELAGVTNWPLPDFLHKISAFPLAAGIAGTVFVLHPNREHHWMWSRLEAAGRMPLTNYVGQSFVMATIAEPWGFDRYGRLDGPALTLLALSVFIFLAVVSRTWLRRIRMGPLEWIWRCVTYWRLLPIRS
jgi:uncharacterized protein